MKLFIFSLLIAPSLSFAQANCDNSVVDSITKKALIVMAERYDSKQIGMGVSIQNGDVVTTSVAILQGRGGKDGVKVDRIGSISVDTNKCAVKNTLIGTFDVLTLE